MLAVCRPHPDRAFAGWNVAMTSLILFFIKYILRIPLRLSDRVLMIGDDAIHGEAAYAIDQHIPLMHRGERDADADMDLESEPKSV